MKVQELLNEERQKELKYTEKRVKGALNKVTLELEGSDSGAMSRLMTRYKRLDRQWKLMEERRNEVNRQVKGHGEMFMRDELLDEVCTAICDNLEVTDFCSAKYPRMSNVSVRYFIKPLNTKQKG